MGMFADLKSKTSRHVHKRGLHGHEHVSKERRFALIMILTGLARVFAWTALTVAYWAHLHFAVTLFASVTFVCLVSIFALIETAWGQVAASFAQYSAANAHHDAERTRRTVEVDSSAIEQDLARLADLQPGPEARALAASIRTRLSHS